MTGPHSIQQFARVLKHVERSARAHGERHLAALPQERREEIDRDWRNPAFDGGLNFKRQWAEQQGEVK